MAIAEQSVECHWVNDHGARIGVTEINGSRFLMCVSNGYWVKLGLFEPRHKESYDWLVASGNEHGMCQIPVNDIQEFTGRITSDGIYVFEEVFGSGIE